MGQHLFQKALANAQGDYTSSQSPNTLSVEFKQRKIRQYISGDDVIGITKGTALKVFRTRINIQVRPVRRENMHSQSKAR